MFNLLMHHDAELISHMGGATKLASRLGYDPKKGGIQRVQNWKKRGIPPLVERDNPWITRVRRALSQKLAQANHQEA